MKEKIKMKPCNKEILINYEEPTEQKSEGGLYIPPETNKIGGTANDFLKEGTVIAVNEKEEVIKEGDKVLFDYRARVRVPNNPTKFLVRDVDIYMIL